MDATALQTEVDTLTATIATEEAQLATDQASLATAQKDLALVSFVNQIEALTADEVTNINGLLNEPSNVLGITLALPTPTEAATTA